MAYGIHKSKGEIISFLGADDRLYNQNTLRYVNKKLDSKKFEIFYGSYQIIDEEDNPIKIIKSVKFDRDFILNKDILYGEEAMIMLFNILIYFYINL